MESLFQILGVFLALVASGYSLSCKQCTAQSTSCTGPSTTCPADNVCLAIYTQTGAYGSNAHMYAMSCSTRDKCDIRGSSSLPYGLKMKMGTSCCSTNDCTPTFPTLPKDSSVSNGLICRSCFSSDSTWCYTSDTMRCTGDENMCLLYTAKISGSSISTLSTAYRGCATKSICDLGGQSQNTGGLSTTFKYICTNGNAGLQKGFYFPAVVCLFLLKLLI